MRRTSSPPSLPLLLTAVAVLLGVLGMHAVSGGSHSPHGTEHPMTSSVPGHGDTAMAGAMESSVDVLVANVSGAVSDLGQPDLPTDPLVAMAAMCVAMLLSFVVALGSRAFARVHGGGTSPPLLAAVNRRRELTRAPPPDLLTRLCVLRT